MLARVIGVSVGVALVGLSLVPGRVGAQQAAFVRVYSPGTPGLFPPKALEPHRLPKVPDAARQAKLSGEFTVDITIGADGHVSDVLVKDAPKESYGMEDALVAAISTWTYDPARLRTGQAVPFRVEWNMGYQFNSN